MSLPLALRFEGFLATGCAVLCAAALPGCLVGRDVEHPSASIPPTDSRLVSDLRTQTRMAADAVAARAGADLLRQAAGDNPAAVGDLRKRFLRLARAAERCTWVREFTPEALAEEVDPDDRAALVSQFDRCGRLRAETWRAADEAAEALASSRSDRAISLEELKKAFQQLHHAEEVERRFGIGGASAAAGVGHRDVQVRPGAERAASTLTAVAPPVPRPFIQATARLLVSHQGNAGLASFTGPLAEDAEKIRAALADLHDRPAGVSADEDRPGPGDDSPGPLTAAESAARAAHDSPAEPAEPNDAAPRERDDGSTREGAPGSTRQRAQAATAELPSHPSALNIAGEARDVLLKRGPPLAILSRPDGLFALRYDEDRPCANGAAGTCRQRIDYLFDQSGKLLRDEPAP